MSTKVQQSIVINQPVEKVYAFLTDAMSIQKWQPGILEAKVIPNAPTQVGTQVTEVRTVLGRKMESTYEITGLEPRKRLSLKSISGPFPYHGSYTFESLSNSTKVTFDAEAEASGFFKLAEGIMAGAMRKEMETSLSRAKQVLEADA